MLPAVVCGAGLLWLRQQQRIERLTEYLKNSDEGENRVREELEMLCLTTEKLLDSLKRAEAQANASREDNSALIREREACEDKIVSLNKEVLTLNNRISDLEQKLLEKAKINTVIKRDASIPRFFEEVDSPCTTSVTPPKGVGSHEASEGPPIPSSSSQSEQNEGSAFFDRDRNTDTKAFPQIQREGYIFVPPHSEPEIHSSDHLQQLQTAAS